jgi:phosphoheptose isomerase
MNISANPTCANASENFGSNVSVFSFPFKAAASPHDDLFGFSTTDGSMVTFNAGTNAISKGAGIFIGDYFVGFADNPFADTAVPFIKY